MDKRLLDFFKENEQAVFKLYQRAQDLAAELRSKVKEIRKGLKLGSFKDPFFWRGEDDSTTNTFFDLVACEAELPGKLWMRVEAKISLNEGWVIYAWNPDINDRLDELRKWFTKAGIQLSPATREGGDNLIFAKFGFEESEATVLSKFQDLISQINVHLKHPSRSKPKK